MRLNKQIKTTCGILTISNHSNSVYFYIKLLAYQISSILVCEAIIITALATYTLKVKIKKITISVEQIFSMFLCNLNVSHCKMKFTVQSMSQLRISAKYKSISNDIRPIPLCGRRAMHAGSLVSKLLPTSKENGCCQVGD